MAVAPTILRPSRPSHPDHIDQHYRRLYTDEAQRYDNVRFNRPQNQSLNTRYLATIVELLALEPGSALLDVAAGTGQAAVHLARSGLQVTALDLTRNMLRQAQTRAEDSSAPVRFIEGNGRSLPFADSQYDGVISTRFLHLFPVAQHAAFVAEMWRVLRPGGTMLVQFDSALAGGVVTLVRELHRRLIRQHKPRYYLLPHQLGTVFGAIEGLSIYGFSVPGAHIAERFVPGSRSVLEAFTARGAQGFLANHVFVRAIKPLQCD